MWKMMRPQCMFPPVNAGSWLPSYSTAAILASVFSIFHNLNNNKKEISNWGEWCVQIHWTESRLQSCTNCHQSSSSLHTILIFTSCIYDLSSRIKQFPSYKFSAHAGQHSGLASHQVHKKHLKAFPETAPWPPLWYRGRKRKHVSVFRCLRAVQSQLCLFVLWLCSWSSSRLAAYVDLGNSGSPRLCAVLSPLWGALHYFPLPLQNVHTFRSHSSQASPIQKHFITVLLVLLTFFLVPFCLNGNITLRILKMQSICLQMQHVFWYSTDIYWKAQHFLSFCSQRSRHLLSACPSHKAKESLFSSLSTLAIN